MSPRAMTPPVANAVFDTLVVRYVEDGEAIMVGRVIS